MRYELHELWRLSVAAFALCLTCSASTSWAQGCAADAVAPFIRQFYARGGHPTAVPSSAELRKPESPFSQRLRESLFAAAMARTDFVSVFSDHSYKPPFVDGDIFKGPPDGSMAFDVYDVRAMPAGRWQVRVRSVEEIGMSPWDVTVRVMHESKLCVIDDVFYPSERGALSLTEILRREVKAVRLEVADERKRSKVHGHSCAKVGDC